MSELQMGRKSARSTGLETERTTSLEFPAGLGTRGIDRTGDRFTRQTEERNTSAAVGLEQGQIPSLHFLGDPGSIRSVTSQYRPAPFVAAAGTAACAIIAIQAASSLGKFARYPQCGISSFGQKACALMLFTSHPSFGQRTVAGASGSRQAVQAR